MPGSNSPRSICPLCDESFPPVKPSPKSRPLLGLLLALAMSCAITAGLASLSHQTALLRSLEHWTSDWRTALLADRAPTQHPRIAIVIVDDDTMLKFPYRSPVNRGLLAQLVTALDAAGARLIALDFLFDQPTEPDKDLALINALSAAKSKVILGTVDERVPLRAERRAYLETFLREAGAATGYLNVRHEIDDVIRGEAEPAPEASAKGQAATSFAVEIARAAGVATASYAPRIAWLRSPVDGSDTFMVLPAQQLVAPAGAAEAKMAELLLASLKDRIVLVGGDLSDHIDRHATPLAKLEQAQIPGVMIHAHAVAQKLDGRPLRLLGAASETALVFAMSLLGLVLGWRYRTSGWLTSTLPVALLAALDAIFFAGLRAIVPFAAPALGWIAGIFTGRVSRWLLQRIIG